ncbi:MAG TPA: YqgE/AlgH family protein [Burkholderiales bacterium]|jgi:putative transcriptional regulator|nr:YqgE/AlgH family protein [Burkholderiales bacterium]
MRTGFVARFTLGCLIAAGTLTARAQDLDKPFLLVASPKTTGFYSGAVLLVMPSGAEHVGFIINHPTRTTVAAAFPNEPDAARVDERIYLGGPRNPQALFALVHSDPGEGSRRIVGEVFLAVGTDALDRVIRTSPREARYFAGFATWGPGELQREIARGAWFTAEPDEGMLFHTHPTYMWAALQPRPQATR